MRTRVEIKEAAKATLRGHWTDAVVFTLLVSVPMMVISYLAQPEVEVITEFGRQAEYVYSTPLNNIFALVSLLTTPLLSFAVMRYFLFLSRRKRVDYMMVLDGFKRFVPIIVLHLRMVLQVFAWTLLLIIPGIVAGFRYSQAIYILNDEKEDTGEGAWKRAGRILGESGKLMDGHKWEYFVLGVSFLGWAILAMIPCGLGYLWLMPYMMTSYAHYYNDLRGRSGAGLVERLSKVTASIKKQAKKVKKAVRKK